VELFTRRWTEYNTPVLPREYAELLLLPSLADRFGGAKDLGVEEEAGAAVGMLSMLTFGDICSGEGGKQAAAEPSRGQRQSQGRKGAAESGGGSGRMMKGAGAADLGKAGGGSGVVYGVAVN